MGRHNHEAYYGDRTKEALVELANNLVPTAGRPHMVQRVAGIERTSRSPGCNFAGFVLVKKVPGTLHFVARAPGHTIDYVNQNMSHTVHSFFFGVKPSPKRGQALSKLHPLGLQPDWMDKMGGSAHAIPGSGATYEHYMQVSRQYCWMYLGFWILIVLGVWPGRVSPPPPPPPFLPPCSYLKCCYLFSTSSLPNNDSPATDA
jgi:hypothetical protein